MGFFSSEFLPTSYQIFRRDRNTDTTGCGVLIALRSDLVAQGEDLHPPGADCEMLWTSLHVTGHPTLYIGAFYRKHHNSPTVIKINFQILKLLLQSYQQTAKFF